MKILLTGCDGTLGSFLLKHLKQTNKHNTIIANTRSVCDLCDHIQIANVYGKLIPNIIVHCAAYTDVQKSNIETRKVFNDNIIASINLIKLAMESNSKFIFISTDFVFDGIKGFYSVNDSINPQSVYAKSKACIEMALSCYSNSLIIRTSFFGMNFPFESACVDRYTSKNYIDIIGPIVADHILGDKTGVVHIGTDRKSFYELASMRKSVQPCYCMSDNNSLGKDHSLLYD